jgi:protein TonB
MMKGGVRGFLAPAVLIGAAGLALSMLQPAAAQAPLPAKPVSEMTPAERAQRDADKVFYLIRLNADKAVKPPVAAAPVAAAVPLRKPVAPARPATDAQAAAAAAPAPDPAPASLLALAAPSVASRPEPVAPEPVPEPAAELPLKLLVRVEPVLPRHLMASMQSGLVQLRFSVQPDGSVKQVETLSSTNKRLASAAIEAVAQWRFEPIPRARDATVELGFNKEE